MVDKRVFILGAGMSGLVAGYEFLKKGVPVTIIEKFEVPGGLAKTIRYEDYYIDSGPHLFHTSNPEIIEYWKELFSDIFTMPSLYGKNYVEGKYFDYPLTEKTLEQLPNELIKTIKSEMGSINKDELSAAKNYHEYMEALAGPTLQKMFYEEYPEKLWGIPTKELSPNWAPQRIEIRKENKPFHSDQWSAVARNGCGHPFEVLAEKIEKLGGKILYSEEVLDINYDNNRANKIITDKQEIELKEDDIIVSTLPITKNSQFFDVDCSLSFRNIILVNLILKDTDPFPDDADWLYFKDKEVIFHRAGLQTRFSKSGIPDGWSILCCEIAYTVGDSISEMSEE
jgi:protoporphyrinogen oxidase